MTDGAAIADLFARAAGRGRRVPVAFWRHHPVQDQTDDGLVRATLEFQARHPGDMVKITPASSFQLRDLGQADAWAGDALGRRDFGPPLVTTPDDWARLIDARHGAAHLDHHLRALARVRAAVPRDVPVVQTVFDPLFQARTLARGVWDSHLRDHPALVAQALAMLTARTVALVARCRDAGADGIFLAVQHGGCAEYRDAGLPAAHACLAAAGADALALVHLHGADLPGWLAGAFGGALLHLSFDQNPALMAALAQRPDVPLGGGLGPGWLARATPDQAGAQTAALVAAMAGRRFLCSAGCVLWPATSGANIDAALAATMAVPA